MALLFLKLLLDVCSGKLSIILMLEVVDQLVVELLHVKFGIETVLILQGYAFIRAYMFMDFAF